MKKKRKIKRQYNSRGNWIYYKGYKRQTVYVKYIRTVGGLYGVDSAEMITQWTLFKEKNETDSNYDYFTLQDVIRINKLGGSTNAIKLRVSHNLIYTKDDLSDASPGDTNSGPYSVTFGYPWTVSWSFTYDGNPNISLTENLNDDTSRWVITPDFLQNLQSSDKFKLGTSWKAMSAYKYTGIKVSHAVEWHSPVQHMFDLTNTFKVGYSW